MSDSAKFTIDVWVGPYNVSIIRGSTMEMVNMNKIESFSGEYKWLSNFYSAWVQYAGLEFANVESAYVASKTEDPEERKKIQSIDQPGKVKQYGRTLKLRDNWERVKISIMADLLSQKFDYGTELGQKLLDTEDADLIEGNTWGDTFWGVYNGKGKNILGKLLMAQRNKLIWLDMINRITEETNEP